MTARGVRMVENGYVRKAPSAASAALGVMKKGETLPFGDRTAPGGWLSVVYRGVPGWVAGRLGEVFDPGLSP